MRIITEVNGIAIDDPAKLSTTLGNLRVGAVLKLALMRAGRKATVELTLVERPVMAVDRAGRRTGAAESSSDSPSSRRGLSAARTFVF